MVTLTEAASRKVNEILAEQGAKALRLGVTAGGCSGYQYTMSIADAAQPGDWEGDCGGVKVLLDAEAQQVMQGVQIDWVETLERTGFAITNPNAVRSCGCGKSFETH
jgi:iron-sulfur cluster assembly accessory protein